MIFRYDDLCMDDIARRVAFKYKEKKQTKVDRAPSRTSSKRSSMNDKEFLELMDRALFYSNAGGGSVLLHADDLERYKKVLPKSRQRVPLADEAFDFWVYHPVESLRYAGSSPRDCIVSNHTSLGMARIGYGNSTKAPHIIYTPQGEQMTVVEFGKRLDVLLASHEPLWGPVYLHPLDLGWYTGSAGQQRLGSKPPSSSEASLVGTLRFGKEIRNLHAVDWVTRGTAVIGYQYSQTTHMVYMWSVPPTPGTRFDRDVGV